MAHLRIEIKVNAVPSSLFEQYNSNNSYSNHLRILPLSELALDFGLSAYSVVEGDGPVFVSITLSGITATDVKVTVHTQSQTATDQGKSICTCVTLKSTDDSLHYHSGTEDETDYQPLEIDVVFLASSIEKQLVMIPIMIVDDIFVEGDEMLEVVLTPPATSGVTVRNTAVPVTIIDDDSKNNLSLVSAILPF